MNSSDQDSDLPAGFLIKDKSGQFKKVQDDTIVDFTVKKTVPPSFPPQQNRPPAQPIKPVSMPPRPASAPLREPLPVKPPSPISSSSNASAFMAPDDEREIREEQAKLEQMMKPPAGSSVVSVEDIVNNAISDFSLSFADEVMRKRFAKVIESRLRDLRDGVETKEVLTRSKKIGGLELPPEQADRLLASIEKHLSGKPVIKPSTPEVAQAPRLDMPPDFIPRPQPVKPAPPPVPQAPIAPKEVVQLAEEIKKEMNVPVSAPPVQPKQPSQPPPVSTPDTYSRPVDELPRIVQVRKLEAERPQVNDIRRPARVMGPVEELADINLDEFRRQGTNPIEAAERVVEKIDLLEHDSWEMKIAGTKAWKRSEANKLYIDIGRESMETGQTVADVIRKRMQEKRPHLLLDEFLAINNLNSRLVI